MNLSDISSEVRDNVVYVALKGDIDMSDTGELRARLTQMISNAATGMVLDLTEVGYLDSAGIHLIHHLRGSLTTRGQRLVIVIGEDSVIAHALRLSGVPWLDEVSHSADDAQAMFGQRCRS